MKEKKKEYEAFPEYIEELRQYMEKAESDLKKLRKSKDWVAEDQFQLIADKLQELSDWAQDKRQERNSKPPTSEPVLTRALVRAKMAGVKELVKALNAFERPKANSTSESNGKGGKSKNKSDIDEDL